MRSYPALDDLLSQARAQLSPVTRYLLEEALSAPDLGSLAELWGFGTARAVARFIEGPFRKRLQREAGEAFPELWRLLVEHLSVKISQS